MFEELQEKSFVNATRYLTPRGQVHFKELAAGKVTAVQLGRITGFTSVYVRMVMGGFRRVTTTNIVILETIKRIADGYNKSYAA